jgi:hypothetical protein
MRPLLVICLVSAMAFPCAKAEEGPSLSKADEAFLAVLATGKPVPKLSPLYVTRGYVGRLDRVYVVQILDKSNAVVFVGGSDYLLRGESTEAMREFTAFALPHPHVAILDLAPYTAPWGTVRSVPAMDVVKIEALREVLANRGAPLAR